MASYRSEKKGERTRHIVTSECGNIEAHWSARKYATASLYVYGTGVGGVSPAGIRLRDQAQWLKGYVDEIDAETLVRNAMTRAKSKRLDHERQAEKHQRQEREFASMLDMLEARAKA